MRKFILTLLTVCVAYTVAAQSVRDEFEKNIRLSGSNLLAYPAPLQDALTPAPDSIHPFYISHYGRHGSRYLIGKDEYSAPYKTLFTADSLGKLTYFGRDVLRRLDYLRKESAGRLGELTKLGAEQHRQIAKRMYERFPEVFDGRANIDAKSTIVIRCILSMENELQQMLRRNPELNITHDASEHDMYYMNLTDTALVNKRMPKKSKDIYEAYCKKYVKYDHVMQQLFNDTAYVNHNVNARKLNDQLFKLASCVQNCESRYKVTLYDLFTDDEIYANWKKNNLGWYLSYGACPFNGGTQPYSQRNLLRKIIEEADSCIALPKPGATLRFGHETMVLPLTCLLGINGYDQQIDNVEQLEKKGWIDYKVFPMGANIQFIFYRKNPQDKDVLVKVLLNEKEAKLPVKTNVAPFYHWNDFRNYYLKKLDAYKN